MKRYFYLLVFFSSLCSYGQTEDFEMIGQYKFVYPSWWNEVSISYPDSLDTQDKLLEYLDIQYGSDVGDSLTWKEAMKYWYVFEKSTDNFPVYFGHCYEASGDLDQAIQVYKDLYEIIPDDSKSDWYHCYLPYTIGQLYAKQNLKVEASTWFNKAAAVKFIDSNDKAISYYAKKAKDWVEKTEKK